MYSTKYQFYIQIFRNFIKNFKCFHQKSSTFSKHFPKLSVFFQTRQLSLQGLITFFKNMQKLSNFCNFLKDFLKNILKFRRSSGGGCPLRTPCGSVRPKIPEVFPPNNMPGEASGKIHFQTKFGILNDHFLISE